MRDNPNLPFEMEEYRSRMTRVQQAINDAGLDGVMVHSPENIYYLTGYHSVGYFTYTCLIISGTGEASMVIRDLSAKTVELLSWIEDVISWTDLQDPIRTTGYALKHRGFQGKEVGYDPRAWFYTISHHQALTQLCGNMEFREASGIIENIRRVKSPKEIEYIRQAAKTCDVAIEGASKAVSVGATENDVAAEAYHSSIKAGSEYLGHAMLVATGRRTGQAFATWHRTPIRQGDLLALEMGGSYMRYNACLSRGAVVGRPSSMAEKLADGSREALQRSLDAVKPGATSGDVDYAARNYLNRQGLGEYFKHRTGYMIGIGFPPDWGEGRIMSINENDPTLLEPGMVFHLIPDVRIDGEIGIIYSDTVLVTHGGHEVLTTYLKDLIIA